MGRQLSAAGLRYLSYGLFALVFGIALPALLWNQSRSAWVVTVLGFAAIAVFRACAGIRQRRFGLKGLLLALVLAGSALAVAWFGAEGGEGRVNGEKRGWAQ